MLIWTVRKFWLYLIHKFCFCFGYFFFIYLYIYIEKHINYLSGQTPTWNANCLYWMNKPWHEIKNTMLFSVFLMILMVFNVCTWILHILIILFHGKLHIFYQRYVHGFNSWTINNWVNTKKLTHKKKKV